MPGTIIIGKTCSGKTKIVDKLVSTYKYKKIVTYTSRPRRKGEVQGKDYHFITEKDFKQKIEDNFFAEWKSYNTEFGVWYYGTALEDLENADKKSIIILTPDGYRDLINKLSDKPTVIYIYANNPTIMKRLKKRGDSKEEAQRRIEHDNADFKGAEYLAQKIIYNNDGTDINDVVEKIHKYIQIGDDK